MLPFIMLTFWRLRRVGQFGDDCERVADDQQVGKLADRRGAVFVDRDDRAGRTHSDFVLDRAGDADRDVEVRRDRLAGLSDLQAIRHPPRIGRGA